VFWVEVQLHEFLTSTLDGGEWSASRPGRFTAAVIAHGSRWIGGWVGRRLNLLPRFNLFWKHKLRISNSLPSTYWYFSTQKTCIHTISKCV